MKTKHRHYLESSLSTIPPRKESRQLDRSLLEEKENMSILNAEKNLSSKSHWHDSSSGELDYLRMIREKEETIKELTSMLQMMNESVGDDPNIQKLRSTIQEYQHQIQQYEQQMQVLEQQVKILTIQNECLISVIQKNEINLPSQRESILQQQIAELKEYLHNTEIQLEETRCNSRNASQKLLKIQNSAKGLSQQNMELSDQNRELQTQCEKLVLLLKEKEECETKRICHLVCKGGERVTLSKIREQYCQNISLTKQYFISESQKMFEMYQKTIKQAEFKLDYLVGKVEQMKKIKEIKSQSKPQEKQASLEIQYLMQKYYQTEKHLEEQKQVNTRLNSELETAQKTLRELSLRSMDGSELFDVSSSLRKGELGQELAKLNEEMTRLKDCQRENSSLKQAMRKLKQRVQHQQTTSNLKIQTVMSCYQNQLKDKISVLNHQLQSKDKQIDVLRQNSVQLTAQLQEATFKLQSSRDLNTQKSEQVSVLQNKIEEIETESKLQLARLKQLSIDAEIKVEKLSQSYNYSLKLLQSEVHRKDQALSSLQEELTSSQDELFKQKNILGDFLNPTLQVELESLKSAVREIGEHSSKRDRSESLRVSFGSELQMKIEDSIKMTQELSQLRSDISQKQRHNISLQTHIDTLQNQIQNLRFQVKQKSLQTSHLQKQKYLIELAHAKPSSLNFEMFIGIVDKLLSLEMRNKEKKDGQI